MSRFWTTYILTAVIATAAAYFGAPALSAQIARAARPTKFRATPAASPHGEVQRLEAIGRSAEIRRPLHTTLEAPASVGNEPLPVGTAPDGAAAVAETVDAPTPQQQQDRPLYRPPAANPEAASWGILKQNAPHYSAAGQNLGTLPAGTIGEVTKTTTSSNGDVAVCTIDVNGQWKGPVLISVGHLVVFEGPLTRVPLQTLDMLHHYFSLKGRADARAAAVQQRNASANPHAVAYRRANEAWTALNARVTPLTTEFNTATGTRRAELLEQLKRMRIEQNRLRIERENAAAMLRAWNEKNPPQSPDRVQDPELAGWLAELNRIEPEIQKIIP